MKIKTNNATIIANANAIKAIGTQIVVVASSVSSFTSMLFGWRSDMRGKRSRGERHVVETYVVEASVVERHVMGLVSHCLGLPLAGLKPAADPACCAYRITQTCQPGTA